MAEAPASFFGKPSLAGHQSRSESPCQAGLSTNAQNVIRLQKFGNATTPMDSLRFWVFPHSGLDQANKLVVTRSLFGQVLHRGGLRQNSLKPLDGGELCFTALWASGSPAKQYTGQSDIGNKHVRLGINKGVKFEVGHSAGLTAANHSLLRERVQSGIVRRLNQLCFSQYSALIPDSLGARDYTGRLYGSRWNLIPRRDIPTTQPRRTEKSVTMCDPFRPNTHAAQYTAVLWLQNSPVYCVKPSSDERASNLKDFTICDLYLNAKISKEK
ncbi:hypothetical protein Bbelb_013420 [Branchiostoma belcheri]|nr:hypothetical protein Bbelb_013420 [Branchiostoma belcheri]